MVIDKQHANVTLDEKKRSKIVRSCYPPQMKIFVCEIPIHKLFRNILSVC